jgi:hypothetical protein
MTDVSELVAVLDTNVKLDIYSCHDVLRTVEQEVAKSAGAPLLALEQPRVTYRFARARESLLLAMYLHARSAKTFSLHHELVDRITTRVPPARRGGESFESEFISTFLHFVKDYVLPDWDSQVPTLPGTEEKNEADRALLAFANEHGLPLITNEGYSEAGIVDEKLRKKAGKAGVRVFTPLEFYRGKMDEDFAIRAFFRRFDQERPRYLQARRREFGEDLGWKLLEEMRGYYRLVLLGEAEGRDEPVRVSLAHLYPSGRLPADPRFAQ